MSKQGLLEYYAGLAMQGIIAKMPLLDRDGTLGTKPEEDLSKVKSDVAKSAYEYAQWMVIHGAEAQEWLEKNIQQQ